MKTPLTRSRGFTIAELLIVIVVIGILATIVLVSYQGTIRSSKVDGAKGSASALQRKIEAYASVKNTYPQDLTAADYTTTLNGLGDSSIDSLKLVIGAPTKDNGTTTFQVSQCQTNPGSAYQIRYFDFAAGSGLSSDVITGSLGGAACDAWQVLN